MEDCCANLHVFTSKKTVKNLYLDDDLCAIITWRESSSHFLLTRTYLFTFILIYLNKMLLTFSVTLHLDCQQTTSFIRITDFFLWNWLIKRAFNECLFEKNYFALTVYQLILGCSREKKLRLVWWQKCRLNGVDNGVENNFERCSDYP